MTRGEIVIAKLPRLMAEWERIRHETKKKFAIFLNFIRQSIIFFISVITIIRLSHCRLFSKLFSPNLLMVHIRLAPLSSLCVMQLWIHDCFIQHSWKLINTWEPTSIMNCRGNAVSQLKIPQREMRELLKYIHPVLFEVIEGLNER